MSQTAIASTPEALVGLPVTIRRQPAVDSFGRTPRELVLRGVLESAKPVGPDTWTLVLVADGHPSYVAYGLCDGAFLSWSINEGNRS